MAIIKAEASFNTHPIQKLIAIFPDLAGGFLALVGSRARRLLKQEYLSGQELNLEAHPKDAKGRYTITSDVNKKRTQVKIYSYPVNLFETGRRLRDGTKEAGKFIITRKLKNAVSSRMANYVSDFENKILNPKIKGAGL